MSMLFARSLTHPLLFLPLPLLPSLFLMVVLLPMHQYCYCIAGRP
jgi:hypothetical protein